ncbi:MAG: GNAT family N-acetyltransferase [Sphingobium sp.]
MTPQLSITTHVRPDVRAEAAAMAIMADAFDPRFGEAWNSRQLSGFTALPRVSLAIARVNAAFMGFTLTRYVSDEAELMLLAVGSEWRRRGIGEALLEDCLGSARKAGIKKLHLEVRANNPAVKLYSKMGFENIHCRPSYYKGSDGTPYDALSYQIDV